MATLAELSQLFSKFKENKDLPVVTEDSQDLPTTDLSAAGPSLFDRVHSQMQKQQEEGNLPQEAAMLPSPEISEQSSARAPASLPMEAMPSQAPKTMPVSPAEIYGSDLNDQALAGAQQSSKVKNLIAGLLNSGSSIAQGISRGAYQATDAGKDIRESADQDVKNILLRRDAKDKDLTRQKNIIELSNEKDKNDPNSDVSKLGQAIAQKLSDKTGIKISNMDKASWSSLEKALPGLERYAGIIEGSENRKLQRESMADARAERKASKDEADMAKQFVKLGDTIDPNSGRKGATAKVQATLNAAERVQALLNQFPDGNIPATQTREIATAVGSLISGGGSGAAVSQINELVPHSLVGDAEKMASWFTNNPRGSQQQKFIKQLSDTVQREKSLAEGQIKRDLLGKIPAFEKLRDKDPATFDNILKARGISPEDYQSFKSGKRSDITASSESNSLKKVKVSNGKETLMIDPSDLDHAKADGYKQVD